VVERRRDHLRLLVRALNDTAESVAIARKWRDCGPEPGAGTHERVLRHRPS
jgi:hypothetical protein